MNISLEMTQIEIFLFPLEETPENSVTEGG